ncbi:MULTISPECIES: hypothetical protein [unclassified Microcoleus]|uniref:hypothetical protein n=1 Tax=unclassified Microcoleus TaxID=2642155 RepID=UPI001DF9F0BE|nr:MULTISPECIES: hypothetical protein [unclassified Microcoleus]MCC3567380.1 hypothetical protein [Microcoleus sp. PH2017_31_RDM_U_A]
MSVNPPKLNVKYESRSSLLCMSSDFIAIDNESLLALPFTHRSESPKRFEGNMEI